MWSLTQTQTTHTPHDSTRQHPRPRFAGAINMWEQSASRHALSFCWRLRRPPGPLIATAPPHVVQIHPRGSGRAKRSAVKLNIIHPERAKTVFVHGLADGVWYAACVCMCGETPRGFIHAYNVSQDACGGHIVSSRGSYRRRSVPENRLAITMVWVGFHIVVVTTAMLAT